MGRHGKWIANCLPSRVERIRCASIYRLEVGQPRPNQLQTLADLKAQGLVGLYRVGEKESDQVKADQASYLDESDFTPAPHIIRDMLGPLGR